MEREADDILDAHQLLADACDIGISIEGATYKGGWPTSLKMSAAIEEMLTTILKSEREFDHTRTRGDASKWRELLFGVRLLEHPHRTVYLSVRTATLVDSIGWLTDRQPMGTHIGWATQDSRAGAPLGEVKTFRAH